MIGCQFYLVGSEFTKSVLSVIRFFDRTTFMAARTQAIFLRSFSSSSAIKSFSFKSKNRNAIRSPKRILPAVVDSFSPTEQQSQILNTVSTGKSVFITGSAGTGKTILLKHIIDILNNIHGPERVFITASTGVAACALGGMTLHSFAGVGLGIGNRENLFVMAASNKETSRRWKKAKALVIDEVSMVDPGLFDNLEYIARGIRCMQSNQVWGGIQLIVCGDFFQLPPVPVASRSKSDKEFAFEAECWNLTFKKQFELTQIFRQSDSQLVEVLQGIRRGLNDREHLQLLYTRLVETEPDPMVIRLYPKRQDVKRVNDGRLRSLGCEIYGYKAFDEGKEPWKSQLKLGVAPDELELCLGARVMLLKNFDPSRGLVNGATGTIVAFEKHELKELVVFFVNNDEYGSGMLLPVVEFDSGQEMLIHPDEWTITEGETVFATRNQLPLILAWAISIHKCQGMTLDCLHTDLSRAFGCGMVYVALSRVRRLDGLHLSGFSSSKIKAHPKVLEFYQNHFS